MSEADPRKILITGVTRGLGRALTEKFTALGHTVIGCGRRFEAVEVVRHELDPDPYLSVVDVLDAGAVQAWALDVLDRFGPPDFLINNAAVAHSGVPFWELPGEDFNRVIDTNIKGTANVLRAFLPAMIERGSGIAVNLSSGVGRFAVENFSAYVASKYAVEGLSKAVAEDLPAGLACIPLSPGVVDTDMLRDHWGEERSGEEIDPAAWAEIAAPFILGLTPADNGASLSVPVEGAE
ncbi:SDR family oxidoreductase [Ruficoccus amylovorans]|uniref:SDR family oxidoreductase n=1 Tax=Ruficoccus amylovorans TaxID=1804625 RepID=A0A842HKH2_9BACT|nr:SDR family oxidoreductase [Ruficoccus amylovorans]MBC2596174.1 SDR family oxidoreductase [Ruficoccus amylovorans]